MPLTETKLSPDSLYLDAQNPRFSFTNTSIEYAASTDPWVQELTRQQLLANHSVRQLMESILRLGFLTIDRMVVRKAAPGQYIVIEGNRRLAAIKTILGDTKRYEISPPPEILASIAQLPVLELQASNDEIDTSALILQGVRHISGVKSWGPYQQGRLISLLVNQQGFTQSNAALAVGLSPSRVGALLRGYYGLQQMFEDSEFAQAAHVGLFSHFEQAHRKIPVREWLGWDEDARQYTAKEALRFFYACITPPQGLPLPCALQARDIRELLPEVLTCENARQSFLTGKMPINHAHALTKEQKHNFMRLKRDTHVILHQIAADQTTMLNKEELDLIRQIHSATAIILQRQAAS